MVQSYRVVFTLASTTIGNPYTVHTGLYAVSDSKLPLEPVSVSSEAISVPQETPAPTESAAAAKLQALAEMAVCSSVPTQLAIGWALRLAGWSPTGADGELRLG